MTDTGIAIGESYISTSTRIKRVFSVFMALYPILCLYTAFYRFTIGDVILMLFFVLSLKHPIARDKRLTITAVFCGYAILSLVINLLFSQVTHAYTTSALVLRLVKFIFYMMCVFTCGRHFFDLDVFKKAMLITAATACFFLFFQYIMFFSADAIVHGHIPFLELYLEEYAMQDYEMLFMRQFRPSSFFLEPGMFSRYIIVALILVLLSDKKLKLFSRILLAILFTVGILMSTAGQGVLYLVIVYIIFVFGRIRNKVASVCCTVVLAGFLVLIYNTIESAQSAFNRLLFYEQAADARMGGFEHIFESDIPHFLIGHGYGTTPDVYLPGAAYVWYGCGIIGLILAFCMFGSFFRNANKLMLRTICSLFFVMFFGTSLFYGYMVYWFFTLVLSSSNANGGEICLNTQSADMTLAEYRA